MILNLIVVAFVIGITFVWTFRGALNSFIHLLCVIAAGAVAFAFWEPLATMLVNVSPERGFFSFLEGIAWGVALIVPFAVTLILLRVATDKIVKSNIKNYSLVDMIFGLIFGLNTAVISTGILVIAIGSMRLSSNFLGYQPIWYAEDRATGAGSLVKTDKLWIPVDWFLSMRYSMLSEGSMSTSDPLAKWYPNLELAGFSNRINAGEGGARTTYNDEAFSLVSSYRVGSIDGSAIAVGDLLKDQRSSLPQKYVDINNAPLSKGYLAGYVISFKSGARERGEKGGQVMVSNGQIQMIAEDANGKTSILFPIATISSSDKGVPGRWRFDSNDVFINSVGGQTTVPMGFEFLVPANHTPIGLVVKGVRVLLDDNEKVNELSSVAARDRIIRSGSLLKGKDAVRQVFNLKDVTVVDGSVRLGGGTFVGSSIQVMFSTTVAKSQGFNLVDDNLLGDGEGKLIPNIHLGRKNTPTDRRLRVDKFSVGKNQQLVQVNVSPDQPASLLGDAARVAESDMPIKLIDTNGNEYEAIGFVYKDDNIFHVRYTKGSTLSGLNDLPALSTSRIGEQTLRILFIVTSKVEIEYLVIGDDAILNYSPALPARNR